MGAMLRFREDGSFKIVQFTDLHWQNGEPADLRTQALMEKVLEIEKPDLIVITGDVIFSLNCRDPRKSFRDAVAPVERSGTPWAAVFGNHDSEGPVTRRDLMKVQMEHRHCIAESGPLDVHGTGNFVATIAGAGGRCRNALYFLDSGSYSDLEAVPGYDWIRHSQIDWYRKQSRRLAQENGGACLPALAFFHIPVPEYEEVWRTQTCYGHRYEKNACPKLNSGFFTAMAETGDVMGTFCGHDHINDYWGEMYGIRLCYGRASGYQTYGRWFFSRGARVIQLREGSRGFETWLRLADGRLLAQSRKTSIYQ